MENIEFKAFECLIKFNIKSIPPDLLSLSESDTGFKIVSYDKGRDVISFFKLIEYSKKTQRLFIKYQ